MNVTTSPCNPSASTGKTQSAAKIFARNWILAKGLLGLDSDQKQTKVSNEQVITALFSCCTKKIDLMPAWCWPSLNRGEVTLDWANKNHTYLGIRVGLKIECSHSVITTSCVNNNTITAPCDASNRLVVLQLSYLCDLSLHRTIEALLTLNSINDDLPVPSRRSEHCWVSRRELNVRNRVLRLLHRNSNLKVHKRGIHVVRLNWSLHRSHFQLYLASRSIDRPINDLWEIFRLLMNVCELSPT